MSRVSLGASGLRHKPGGLHSQKDAGHGGMPTGRLPEAIGGTGDLERAAADRLPLLGVNGPASPGSGAFTYYSMHAEPLTA